MKYRRISSKANRYILTIHLLIAICLNFIFLLISIFLAIFIENDYKIVVNFIGISFTIFIYLWAFLRANILINNYRYCITHNKVEVIRGALIISRKIMMLSKIFKIEIKRGIIGRMFKVACIKFYSNGGSIKVCYIDYDDVERAEEIVKKRMELEYEGKELV